MSHEDISDISERRDMAVGQKLRYLLDLITNSKIVCFLLLLHFGGLTQFRISGEKEV